MNDPLGINIDITNTDTTRPIIPDRTETVLVCKEVKVEPNKAGTGRNLVVTFQTAEPLVSTRGKTIAPGFMLTRWFPLQASPKQIEAGMETRYLEELATLVDAFFNTTQGTRPVLSGEVVSQMAGRTCKAVIRVEAAQDGSEANSVGRLFA